MQTVTEIRYMLTMLFKSCRHRKAQIIAATAVHRRKNKAEVRLFIFNLEICHTGE